MTSQVGSKAGRQSNRSGVLTATAVASKSTLMDIGKIYAAGRQAVAEGRDLDAAIVAFVQTVRKN